jgi:hypothetical protein
MISRARNSISIDRSANPSDHIQIRISKIGGDGRIG